MTGNRSIRCYLYVMLLWILHIALPASGAQCDQMTCSIELEQQIPPVSRVNPPLPTDIEAARKTLTEMILLLDSIRQRQMIVGYPIGYHPRILARIQYGWSKQQQIDQRLIDAIIQSDTKQALALLKAGANPHTRYQPAFASSPLQPIKQSADDSTPVNLGPTALMLACGSFCTDAEARQKGTDQTQLVSLLLEHGAEVNTPAEGGFTCLMAATRLQRIVRLLLEHGADVNARTRTRMTPLMYASYYLNVDAVRLLLEHGAEVNAKSSSGRTPLYWTMQTHNSLKQKNPTKDIKDIIRQLLVHGADPNIPTDSGDTALQLAQRNNRPDLIALLKQYGARDTGKQPGLGR